jgi:hypothetical protein
MKRIVLIVSFALGLLAGCGSPREQVNRPDSIAEPGTPRSARMAVPATGAFQLARGDSIVYGKVVIDSVRAVAVVPPVIDTVIPPADTIVPPADTVVPPVVDTAVAVRGVPYGAFNLFNTATDLTTPIQPAFNLSHTWDQPSTIVSRITSARAKGVKLVLVMTAGRAGALDTVSTSPLVTRFNLTKWKATLNKFNTPAIKAAVAQGVADGTIVGYSLMDEPNHRDWGGVVTKKTLDDMAVFSKSIFPTLPTGVTVVAWWRSGKSHSAQLPQPADTFKVVDFYISQYDWWQSPYGPRGGMAGNYLAWRDTALSLAKQQGMKVMFSMNLLAGGVQDLTEPIEQTCPMPLTGGKGIRFPTCKMSAAQVRDWGKAFGEKGCGVLMWRWDGTFMARADNQQAFKDVANYLKQQPARSCKRG